MWLDDGEVGAGEIGDVVDAGDDLEAVVGEITIGAVDECLAAENNGEAAGPVLKVDEVEVLDVVHEEHGVLKSCRIAAAVHGFLAINQVDRGASGEVGEGRRIKPEEIKAVGYGCGTSKANDFIGVCHAGDADQADGVLRVVGQQSDAVLAELTGIKARRLWGASDLVRATASSDGGIAKAGAKDVITRRTGDDQCFIREFTISWLC